MRNRISPIGDKNLIGVRVRAIRLEKGILQKELLARLQVQGVDLGASSLSKLEGQLRPVSDVELAALAKVLGVSSDELLGLSER